MPSSGSQFRHGPTSYPADAQVLQHQLEPPEDREDARCVRVAGREEESEGLRSTQAASFVT
jgi:hypothetical protein